jgi:hypothetical protein
MYLRGAQLDSISFFVTPHMAEAKKPTNCRLYGKNFEEFVGQTTYDYDDDDDDDDYGGDGGNDYDYDIVCLQSATKCNFPYI